MNERQVADRPSVSRQHEYRPLHFSGDENASYERHLVFDHAVEPELATDRERFEALAGSLRDLLTERWLKTEQIYNRQNPKRVYYLSMEFLLGRSLTNNIANLGVETLVRDVMTQERLDLMQLAETEPDAGLGNGGLGRLAACYIDSPATQGIPAIGYGLRYEYGIFRQEIQDGYQIESPDNWLPRQLEIIYEVNRRFLNDVRDRYPADEGRVQRMSLIAGDHFSRHKPGIFVPILDTLLTHGDFYMHLADLTSYAAAQSQVSAVYQDPEAWARKAIINVASSGKFSSDRAIAEYATEIWKVKPCPPCPADEKP